MGGTNIAGLFGSNTSTMLEKTKVPMLLIHLDSKFSRDPVITLSSDFSADLSSEDGNALNELITPLGHVV